MCIIHMLLSEKAHLKKGKRIPPHHPKSTKKKERQEKKRRTYLWAQPNAYPIDSREHWSERNAMEGSSHSRLCDIQHHMCTRQILERERIEYHHHQSLSSPQLGSSDDKHTFIPNRRNTNRRRVDLEIFRLGQRSRGNCRGDFEGC